MFSYICFPKSKLFDQQWCRREWAGCFLRDFCQVEISQLLTRGVKVKISQLLQGVVCLGGGVFLFVANTTWTASLKRPNNFTSCSKVSKQLWSRFDRFLIYSFSRILKTLKILEILTHIPRVLPLLCQKPEQRFKRFQMVPKVCNGATHFQKRLFQKWGIWTAPGRTSLFKDTKKFTLWMCVIFYIGVCVLSYRRDFPHTYITGRYMLSKFCGIMMVEMVWARLGELIRIISMS